MRNKKRKNVMYKINGLRHKFKKLLDTPAERNAELKRCIARFYESYHLVMKKTGHKIFPFDEKKEIRADRLFQIGRWLAKNGLKVFAALAIIEAKKQEA